MGGNSIIIGTGIDASGFKKGCDELKAAITSFGRTASRMSNQFSGLVKRILTIGPSLLGIGGVISILSKSVSAFLSANSSLSAQLNAAWTGLGNVLGPIITQMINWITYAISLFINLLGLLGVSTKAAKKAGGGAGGAAKELQKTLLGFDELNLLNKEDGGGGGGGAAGALPEAEIPEWLNNIVELIKAAKFEEAGQALAAQLNSMLEKLDTATLGQKFSNIINAILEFGIGVIEDFDWRLLGYKIYEFFTNIDWQRIKNNILTLGSEALQGAFNFLWGLLGHKDNEDLTELETSIDELKTSLQKLSDVITDVFQTAWENVLKPALEATITDGLPTSLSLISNELGIISSATEWIVPLIQEIKSEWGKLKSELDKIPVIGDAVDLVADAFKRSLNPLQIFEDGLNSINGLILIVVDSFKLLSQWSKGEISAGEMWEGFKKLGENWENSTEKLNNRLSETTEKMKNAAEAANEVEGVSGKLESVQADAAELSTTVDAAASTTKAQMNGLRTDVTTTSGELKKTVDDTATQATESAKKMGTEITTQVDETVAHTTESVEQTKEDTTATVDEAIETIRSSINATVAEAHSWGVDLMQNLIDGIRSQIGNLGATMSQVASTVRQYIHFTEPDVGPLSDFHTYMPDMMKSISEGILSNKDKAVNAIRTLADDMSNEFQSIDYSADMIGKMQSIADNVAFTMPPIAAGTVTPYSVTDSTTESMRGNNALDYQYLMESMESIRALLQDILEKSDIKLDGMSVVKGLYKYQSAVQRMHGQSMTGVK